MHVPRTLVAALVVATLASLVVTSPAAADSDLNGDGRDDLVVGVPDEAIAQVNEAGVVNVIRGGANGLAPARDRLWDCATGNGQAAAGLAEHFLEIHATDASAEQIGQAIAHPRIAYSVQEAEHTTFDDDFFDVVTVAQAMHWFRVAEFGAEASRVLRPGGLLLVLDMLRPEPEEPFNRQFYYRLDRGEHFRNWAEFEALFRAATWFADFDIELVPTTKLGIRVIDQVVIRARTPA